MKKCLTLLIFLIFLVNYSIKAGDLSDYDPSSCDWENTSDECFQQAQDQFASEKTKLDNDIADLQAQNDKVSQEINDEMAKVNSQVETLQKEMDTFQKEMDAAFADMIPADMQKEMDEDLKELESLN